MANLFLVRVFVKKLDGSDGKIAALKSELADQQMWLEESEKVEARRTWLRLNMPRMAGSTIGKEHGRLLQSIQDELFDRKLKVEQQQMLDPKNGNYYTEVAVRFRVRGDESELIDWLTTLQSPNQFQVIKQFSMELDRRASEEKPQAVCGITIARWFVPDGMEEGADFTSLPPENPPAL